jgi:membrane protease subunit (stomatin/prohibitin family)
MSNVDMGVRMGMGASCVVLEDVYYQQQQQQQQQQHAQERHRGDHINGSSSSNGGNVFVVEYWQPGVAVEKIFHLQVTNVVLK